MAEFTFKNSKTLQGRDGLIISADIFEVKQGRKRDRKIGTLLNDGNGGQTDYWFKKSEDKNSFEHWIAQRLPRGFDCIGADEIDTVVYPMLDRLEIETKVKRNYKKQVFFMLPEDMPDDGVRFIKSRAAFTDATRQKATEFIMNKYPNASILTCKQVTDLHMGVAI